MRHLSPKGESKERKKITLLFLKTKEPRNRKPSPSHRQWYKTHFCQRVSKKRVFYPQKRITTDCLPSPNGEGGPLAVEGGKTLFSACKAIIDTAYIAESMFLFAAHRFAGLLIEREKRNYLKKSPLRRVATSLPER